MNSDNLTQQLGEARTLWEAVTGEGLLNAAKGFGGLLGKTIVPTQPQVRLVPLNGLTEWFGGPENEVVGIYLQGSEGVVGQMLLVLPYPKAVELAGMILEEPETRTLGAVEQSALAELGNLTISYFLNAIARETRVRIQPTPPVVMVDMLGAILQVLVTGSPSQAEELLVLHTTFCWEKHELEVDFWLIPGVHRLPLWTPN